MDRISTLRNIEAALTAFEAGETDLAGLEREVRGILRTYATEFEGEMTPFRAEGPDLESLVVLAGSPGEARERVTDLVDDPGRFSVERVE